MVNWYFLHLSDVKSASRKKRKPYNVGLRFFGDSFELLFYGDKMLFFYISSSYAFIRESASFLLFLRLL